MGAVLSLYEKDFYAWTQEQARLIKEKTLEKLDLEHLQEELRVMGAREKSELRSRLKILLMHLLKWKYQPNYINKKSLRFTIEEQRDQLNELLMDNPSLRSKLAEILPKAYKSAYREAIIETGLPESYFPKSCDWEIAQILDDEFLPS